MHGETGWRAELLRVTYAAVAQRNPALVNAIRVLVAAGQTPKQITDGITEGIVEQGSDSWLEVFNVAAYLTPGWDEERND